MSNSEEEEIARNYICFEESDCIVVVVDATRLERNLNLVKQIVEIQNNVIVCVNLLDEAAKKGISIDLELLEQKLGVPVAGVIARRKKTLKELCQKIEDVCTSKIKPEPQFTKYEENVENAIKKLQNELQIKIENEKLARWIAIKFLEGNNKITEKITQKYGVKISETNLQVAKRELKEEKIEDLLVGAIMRDIEAICKEVVHLRKSNYNERDKKIDKILTSKLYGIPIMILFLGLIFWLTITGANYPSQLLSDFFTRNRK